MKIHYKQYITKNNMDNSNFILYVEDWFIILIYELSRSNTFLKNHSDVLFQIINKIKK
jgi:hypothetical protein